MNFWKHTLSGKDNVTADIGRLAIIVVVFLFPTIAVWGLFMVTWAFFHDKTFDLLSSFNAFSIFISAFGAFMVTGAGALAIKRKTEPDVITPSTQEIQTTTSQTEGI